MEANTILKSLCKLGNEHKIFLAILLFSMLIRLFTFTGLTNCHSQDDSLYVNAIISIIENTFTFPKNLINEKYANPVWVPTTRIGMLYPTAFFTMLLGTKSYVFPLFSLLSFFGMLTAIYVFSLKLWSKTIGEIACFLVSIYPLNVIYSTRIMPDVPMTFFSVLGIFIFLYAPKSKRKKLCLFLSGAMIGIGYLIKPLGVIALLPLIASSIIQKRKREILPITLGFTLIFLLELLYFFYFTGEMFYKFELLSKIYKQKFEIEYGLHEPSGIFYMFNFYFPHGYEFFYHLKKLFNIFPFEKTMVFHGYLGIAGIASCACMLLFKKLRKFSFIVLWALLIYLYLEFGATYITVENGKINYFLIFKEADSEKLEQILIIPLCISTAIVLSHAPKNIRIFLLLLLFFTSMFAVWKTHHVFNDGMKDIRTAAEILKNLPPKTVYTDYLAIGQLNYYLDYSYPGRFVNFYGKDIKELRDGYIIVGGARGCDIVGDVIYSISPKFVFLPPESWKLIAEFQNKKTSYRAVNMRIYEIR